MQTLHPRVRVPHYVCVFVCVISLFICLLLYMDFKWRAQFLHSTAVVSVWFTVHSQRSMGSL